MGARANITLLLAPFEHANARFALAIDQFRYIKIQPKTIDLSPRLRGITAEFVGFIPWSLVLRSIVLR